MGSYNRDRSDAGRGAREFGRRDSGRSGGFGGGRDRDSGRPTMHKAVCDECGNSCEVPFRPSGEKAVYCNQCFRKEDNGSAGRSNDRGFGDRGFGRDRNEDKQMFKAVCGECGDDCEVPFRPSAEKPVYCSECFGKGGKGASKNSEASKEQFEMLNAKLDKILKMITPIIPKEKAADQKDVVGVEEEKTAKPKKAAKKSKKTAEAELE